MLPAGNEIFETEFLELLRRHGLASTYGLARVHHHFELQPHEILVERAVGDRCLESRPARKEDSVDTIPTIWYPQLDASGELRLTLVQECKHE